MLPFVGRAEGDVCTAEFTNPDQITTTARDGHVVHTVVSDTDSGFIIVRLQKTSPTNSQLRQISNVQAQTGALQIGVLTVADPLGSGEFWTLTHAVLSNRPGGAHADEQPVIEWRFTGVLSIIQNLIPGLPFGVTPPYPQI